MLVYISKGLINIQHNFTQGILNKGLMTNKDTGIAKYELSLLTRLDALGTDIPTETIFQYDLSDLDSYNEDFKLLKDCFLNACRQQNVSLFQPTDVSSQVQRGASLPIPSTVQVDSEYRVSTAREWMTASPSNEDTEP